MRDIIAAWGNLLKRGADSAASLDQISQKNQICHSEPMCDSPSDYIVLFRCGCRSLSSAEVGLACAYRERSQRCAYSSAVMGDLLFHATVLRAGKAGKNSAQWTPMLGTTAASLLISRTQSYMRRWLEGYGGNFG